MQPLRDVHEARVARAGIAPGETLELRAHRRRVGREIERRAVLEEAAPLRVEPRRARRNPRAAGRLREDPAQHRRAA